MFPSRYPNRQGLRVSALLALTVLAFAIAACAPQPDSARFQRVISADIGQADPAETPLAVHVPLCRTRWHGEAIELDTRDWSFDYALLQMLADAGVLEPGRRRRAAITYAPRDAEAAHNLLRTRPAADGLDCVAARIGHWQVDRVADFTPADDAQKPAESDVTASLLLQPANWLSPERFHRLTQAAAGIYHQAYPN